VVPETEREFTNREHLPEFNLVAGKGLGVFRAIFHTVVSRLTILFAFAVDGVAELIEQAPGFAQGFGVGLFGSMQLIRGHSQFCFWEFSQISHATPRSKPCLSNIAHFADF
jgi:hypothetical protein